MISYDEALARVLAAVESPLPSESVSLRDIQGRALAADLLAPLNLPPFDNAMVDGFAVRLATTSAASHEIPLTLPITGEVSAGSVPTRALRAGEAWRIYTGAPIPEGCDALVMVEDTEEDEDEPGWVTLRHSGFSGFIRKRGSDIVGGALAIAAGLSLGPGEIALMASLGVIEGSCPRMPRVGLLTTGDELVPVGRPLGAGQIYNSNGPALETAIVRAGGIVAACIHARDTVAATEAAFDALADCDVIVSSGGVSMGDHDHVKAVLEKRGGLDFWRIAIKPGKPLAFGKIGSALFFGLPGNPASSLVTFELFVRPVLRKLMGQNDLLRMEIHATLATPLEHSRGRREFVRASLEWRNGVAYATPTGEQTSHRTHSLVGANALLIAHENHGDYGNGDVLPALLTG
ncbi:MAG: molybdopterin molybdotransferase MoeA [Armatimonas sp.]